jgi:hypothetical protein
MSEQTEQPFDSWSGAAQMLAGPRVAEGLSSGLEQRCGKLIAARRTPHAARRTPHAARRTPHAARRRRMTSRAC